MSCAVSMSPALASTVRNVRRELPLQQLHPTSLTGPGQHSERIPQRVSPCVTTIGSAHTHVPAVRRGRCPLGIHQSRRADLVHLAHVLAISRWRIGDEGCERDMTSS
jgi:hypothetical protein